MEEAQEQKPAKYHERSAGGEGESPDARLWRWVVRDSGHFCRVFTKLWAWLRRRLPHPQLMLKREPNSLLLLVCKSGTNHPGWVTWARCLKRPKTPKDPRIHS